MLDPPFPPRVFTVVRRIKYPGPVSAVLSLVSRTLPCSDQKLRQRRVVRTCLRDGWCEESGNQADSRHQNQSPKQRCHFDVPTTFGAIFDAGITQIAWFRE